MSFRASPHRWLLAAALGAALQGCSTPQAGGPRETLSAYSRALSEGRVREAYDLLSEDAKKTVPLKAFERMVRENPEEVREISRALARPSAPPRVTATITSASGDTLLLVYEDGQWRIDASAIDLYDQSTPKTAIQAFVRAFHNKRYDVLMRFVPDAKAADLDPDKLKKAFEGEQRDEMERLVQALKAALPTARIEHLGTRATMSYGAGGTAELLLEHGIWKIEEF